MQLSNMRYKTFVWPHNPRVYSIQLERKMAVNKVPFGRYKLQNLGMTRRVMRGEGEFVGPDAYDQFRELGSLFYQETPGTLVHPLWNTTSAWFVDLKLEQEPRADYVKYSFEFWEDNPRVSGELKAIATEKQSGNATEGATENVTGNTTENVTESVTESGENSASEVWHTVIKGECLWGIAVDYGVPLAKLIELNPQIKNPNLIYVGQKVRVS